MTDYMTSETSPWIKVEMSHWKPFLDNYVPVAFRKNTTIYSQGQPAENVYIIHTGRVGMFSILPNGDAKQIYIGDTGSILGEVSCIRNQSYIGSAITMTYCKVYKIPSGDLYQEMQRNWKIAELVINSICRKSGLLHYQVMEMSFASPLNKTVRALLHLVKDYGEPTRDGMLITIKFTHEEVANLINASRTTVSGIFSRLTKDGIIEKIGGFYVIRDMNALLQLEKDSNMQLW